MVRVGADVDVGASVCLALRPHADKAKLNEVMPLNLRKSRREKFSDCLFFMTRSIDRTTR
jgi:hypothetical protein